MTTYSLIFPPTLLLRCIDIVRCYTKIVVKRLFQFPATALLDGGGAGKPQNFALKLTLTIFLRKIDVSSTKLYSMIIPISSSSITSVGNYNHVETIGK